MFARLPSGHDIVNTEGHSAEPHGWTAKTANIGTAIRQIPYSTIILGVENTIQKSSDYLFRFSIGCYVMDLRR